MKKWFILLMITIITLTLGACSEGKAKEDLSDYPEVVQNGEVSTIFYDNYMELVEINDEYIEKTRDVLKSQGEKADNRFDNAIKEHNNYLKKVKLSPSTKLDREIDNLLRDVLAIRIEVNSISSLYNDTENEIEKERLNDSLFETLDKEREAKVKLGELLDKHGFR